MDLKTGQHVINDADYALLLQAKAAKGEVVFSQLAEERVDEFKDAVHAFLSDNGLLQATTLSKETGIARNTCSRFIETKSISAYNLFALCFYCGFDPTLTPGTSA